MTSPMNLCFDLDGTIVDIMTSVAFMAYNTTWFGPVSATSKLYTHDDFTQYNFANLPKEEAQKLFLAFARKGVFSKALAYPEAVKTVQYFLNRPEDYKVKFVSHFLPSWEYAYTEKVNWLRTTFNTDIDKDFIVCKNRNNIVWDVLIDDCLDNALACADSTKGTVLLPDRPWNQGELPASVKRCFGSFGWQDIKAYISHIRLHRN